MAGRGRPKKFAGETEEYQVHAKIDKALRKRIDRHAKETSLTPTGIVIQALRQYFAAIDAPKIAEAPTKQ